MTDSTKRKDLPIDTISTMISGEMDVALQERIATDGIIPVQQSLDDMQVPAMPVAPTPITIPKPWECRSKNDGLNTMQVYLPSGPSTSMTVNGFGVVMAPSLVTATGATPDVAGYYDIDISKVTDAATIIYRWMEKQSSSTDGKWPINGTGQWNLGTALPSSTAFLLPLAIAVKVNGIWIATDAANHTDYIIRGDGDVNGTSGSGAASIITIATGEIQLVNWTAGASSIDLTSSNSPKIYSQDANGVGQIITLSKIQAGVDWTVTYSTSDHNFYQQDATHTTAPGRSIVACVPI